MSRRCTAALAAACVLLVPAAGGGWVIAAPSAQAGWFASEPVDGPADITEVGGVDLARDGNGAVVYLRRDSGVAHVFVSRIFDGAFHGPEQVDAGIADEATDAAVAAADDHRLVVVWIAGNRVYGSFTPGGSVGTLSPPQLLGEASDRPSDIDVDMGINGTAYATFTLPGAGGSDVAAVRLQGSTWEGVPQPLDVDPNRAAGHSRVAVSAEGYAVATWVEQGTVFARRITGLNVSVAPEIVSDTAAGMSDSPDIDIEDDGSFAWVVFRQDLGSGPQVVGRRLVGSQFEAPAVLGGPGSAAPAIAMDERGFGEAVFAGGDGSVIASLLEHDAFQPPFRLDGGGGTEPQVAVSERQDIGAAWLFGAGQVAGRYRAEDKVVGPPALLSAPELGSVAAGSLRMASDRAGDDAVAMLQGDLGARRLTVAVYDRPPGAPFIYSSTRFQKRKRPELKWRAGLELWGTPTYNVMVDRVLWGTSNKPSFQVVKPLSEGPHRLRIVQVDRRGQTALSSERFIRVDTAVPTLRVRLSGKRRRGSTLKLSVRASDAKGSGLKYVEIDWGDKSRRVRALRAAHRYRAGRFTLAVKAVDNVGNVARRTIKLRIKK
jgi:hypothetical protein